MKRAFALMMALVLVLSLSITTYATGNDGSITITNATKDHTYKLYKIFDATYDANAEDTDGDGTKDTVSYSITKKVMKNGTEIDNPIFTYMFTGDGISVDEEKGTISNAYFTYVEATGLVTRNQNANNDKEIFDYLAAMVRELDQEDAPLYLEKKTATDKTVLFENLAYGYYLIDKTANADATEVAVTITSNTPAVNVIDKNQKPNANDSFNKLVWDEDYRGEGQETRLDENGDEMIGKWVESTSANVGDIIEWQISFNTTNYDGDDVIMYYTIRDEKSPSLWIEFDDIEIKVGNKTLTKGYYYCANDAIDTDEWSYLGTGWGKDADGNPTGDPNTAEWYLIHYTYDEIEIVIPWMDDYTFEGVQSATKGYELTFDFDEEDENEILSESIYPSPSTVVITYTAAVGPDAAGSTATNSAVLDWITVEGPLGPDTPQTTETKVYNMGITKVANDGTATSAATRLAGAIFELYRSYDEKTNTYSDPVNVIPTNNEGVYILDDIDTEISGQNKVYSREMYDVDKEALDPWETYILNDPNPEAGEEATQEELIAQNRRNDVVTPASGQVVILGLEAGTYYLKETKAPEGYNQLPTAAVVVVGEGYTSTFDNGYKTLPTEEHPEGIDVKYSVYNKTVENNRGFELPSTGGEGTVMLITFGSMIAMAFAVLMITQKKMSIYRD